MSPSFSTRILLWLLVLAQTAGSLRPPFAAADLSCLAKTASYLSRNQVAQVYENPSFGPAVGVEVEGYVDAAIGKEGLADVIEKTLRERFPGLKIRRSGGWIRYERNGNACKWVVISDNSIGPPEGAEGAEVVSPILRSSEDVVEYFAVMDELRKAGFKSEPLTSGVHVHVDFSNPTVPELAALHDVFVGIEEELISAFSQAQTRRVYAARLGALKFDSSEFAEANIVDPSNFLERFKNRNKTLNFQALVRHGTVEFRLFNSTLDLEALQVMIDFSQKLVGAVRSQDPRLMNYLKNTPQTEISLRGVAKALNMKLATSERVLERIAEELNQAFAKAGWDSASNSAIPEATRSSNRNPIAMIAAVLAVASAAAAIYARNHIKGWGDRAAP